MRYVTADKVCESLDLRSRDSIIVIEKGGVIET